MISGITWYDVLGVLPDAPTGDIGTAWEASRAVLQPAALAGAPPEVLPAAERARQVVDEAWRVLADPATRAWWRPADRFRAAGGGPGPARAGAVGA